MQIRTLARTFALKRKCECKPLRAEQSERQIATAALEQISSNYAAAITWEMFGNAFMRSIATVRMEIAISSLRSRDHFSKFALPAAGAAHRRTDRVMRKWRHDNQARLRECLLLPRSL